MYGRLSVYNTEINYETAWCVDYKFDDNKVI